MELQDSRRLTGLNLLSTRAGAVAEVRFETNEKPEDALQVWSSALDRLLSALEWPTTPRWVRRWDDGASLLIDAPLDALYAATEINEWAIAEVNGEAPPLEEALAEIKQAIEEEASPKLMALQAAADQRDVPFVWDDDWICLGMGRHSQTWATDALPDPDAVSWETLQRIPVGYITGTNGKTTTTRMTTRILQAAGLSPGCTSSDGVVVKGEEVERGDWTGPGAARRVLRDSQVDVAVLETARGGILRRGLVVDTCDAALITNVANDHLGDYGVFTVEDMARTKGLVCQAVVPDGRRVLNADDPLLQRLGQQPGAPVSWFSIEPVTPWLQSHLDQGGEAWLLEDGWLVFHQGRARTPVVEAAQLPSAYGGTARHNIANALGAAALSHALGAEISQVSAGLLDFGGDSEDNPGRCNIEEHNGVQVLLDFGHNPHGVRAILKMARSVLANRDEGRLWVSLGQAGDRSDEDIVGLSQAVWEARPHMVSLREVVGYERGRERQEVARIMAGELVAAGHPEDHIRFHDDEVDAITNALEWARPGDLVVHLVHIQREAVRALLNPVAP